MKLLVFILFSINCFAVLPIPAGLVTPAMSSPSIPPFTGVLYAVVGSTTPVSGNNFGYCNCLSRDGKYLFSTSPYYNTALGKGEIFIKSGAAWISQLVVIPTPSGADNGNYGLACAMDAEGTKIAAGSDQEDRYGVVYISSRLGDTWTQIRIPNPAFTNWVRFGSSVSLSSDGTRLIVGATGANNVVYFLYDGSSYITTQTINVSAAGLAGPSFGISNAISYDGNYLAVGSANTSNQGIVSIFKREGVGVTSWIFKTNISSPLPTTGELFGAGVNSLSISEDGTTILIGASGGSYTYKRVGENWSLMQKLPGVTFGPIVKLTNDGQVAYVGSGSNSKRFTRTGDVWTSDNLLDNNTTRSMSATAFGDLVSIGNSSATFNSIVNAGAVYIYE